MHLAGMTFARLSDRSQRPGASTLYTAVQRTRQLLLRATETAEHAVTACEVAKGPRPHLATACLYLTALLQDLYLEIGACANI